MRRVLLALLLLLGTNTPARAQLLAAREGDALGGSLVRVGTSTEGPTAVP